MMHSDFVLILVYIRTSSFFSLKLNTLDLGPNFFYIQ